MSAEQRGGFHAYGERSGFCADPACTQSEKYHTLNIDLAPKGDTGKVEWSRKVSLQPGPDELPLLAATLLGYRPDWQIARPGKSLKIQRQPNSLYVSGGPQRGLALELGPGDAYRLSVLVLSRMARNNPELDSHGIIAAIRGSCMYKEAK